MKELKTFDANSSSDKGLANSRRNFLGGMIAVSSLPFLTSMTKPFPKTGEYILPEALQKGDTIGIIAPGTAVSDPDMIAKAKEAADYFGLNTVFGKSVASGSGHFSRTVEERIEDLHAMFKNPEIKGVFCIRGGYGASHLLDKIDYDLIAKNPKIFIGYSDITALHIAINKMSKLVTFHGPVMLSGYTQYTIDNFRKAIFSTKPIGLLTNPEAKGALRNPHPLRTIRKGKASGKLVGGNLSLIAGLMGTPYEIETKDKILFLEDVGEEPYKIDRMLTQLRLAGKLKEVSGIIFGECSECNYEGLNPSKVSDYSLGEVLDNILGPLGVPVLSGLTIGHTADQLTLPLGVEAELDAENGILAIKESATR